MIGLYRVHSPQSLLGLVTKSTVLLNQGEPLNSTMDSSQSTASQVSSFPPPNPQLTSPLFVIFPLEIRQQIYKEVVASFGWGEKLHILHRRVGVAKKDAINTENYGRYYHDWQWRLTYIPCTSPPDEPLIRHRRLYRNRYHETCKSWFATEQPPPSLQGTYLNLFVTCRRVYVFYRNSISSSIQSLMNQTVTKKQ